MIDTQESITAKLCSFARAYHSNYGKQKIFDDYLAYDMMGKEEYEEIGRLIERGFLLDGDTPNIDFRGEPVYKELEKYISPIPLSRSAFAEKELVSFASRHGACQYVICGAGMDTFSFRNENSNIEIFELDHPDTQKYKLDKINRLEWNIPKNVHFVAVDFEKDDMDAALRNAGLDKTIPSFFAILGVTYYLTLPVFEQTVAQIRGLSFQESRIVFDYPDETTFMQSSPERVKRLAQIAEGLGEPMTQGYLSSELKDVLKRHDFEIAEHFTPDKIQEEFFKNREDGQRAFENIHFIAAQKKEETNMNTFISTSGSEAKGYPDKASDIISHPIHKKKYKEIESALIYGGIYGDKQTGAVNVPIYQTSTYEQESLGHHKGYEYSRTGNPTRAALEALIAELEKGTAGFAFASGMAAITAVLSLFKMGDKVIISSNVYGGTFRVLDKVFSNFGITYSIEDTTDIEGLDKKITPDVKAILVESPANPLLTITDLRAVADLAKKHRILSIADNTFMTPYLQRPIELGVDIVIYSATKYLGGHSDLVAGLVVVNSDDLAQRLAFIQNSTGGVLQPFDSFLLIRGIKTLSVRMDRHVLNAKAAADFLKNHKAVKKVYYPGLSDAQGFEMNKKQAKNGGAMISFELYENYSIEAFFSSLKLIALAESLGGVESLVCHPASMTHASIPYEIRQKVGITDGLIRLSVGIENINDILADLGGAIEESEVK